MTQFLFLLFAYSFIILHHCQSFTPKPSDTSVNFNSVHSESSDIHQSSLFLSHSVVICTDSLLGLLASPNFIILWLLISSLTFEFSFLFHLLLHFKRKGACNIKYFTVIGLKIFIFQTHSCFIIWLDIKIQFGNYFLLEILRHCSILFQLPVLFQIPCDTP